MNYMKLKNMKKEAKNTEQLLQAKLNKQNTELQKKNNIFNQDVSSSSMTKDETKFTDIEQLVLLLKNSQRTAEMFKKT